MRAIDSLIVIGYQCQICGQFAPSWEEIKAHVRTRHRNNLRSDTEKIDMLVQQGYSCQECAIFNRTYPGMSEHIRTMHNELVTNTPRHKVAREVRRP